MSYYDHKWQPWRTRGKATSVASMAVWERPRKWNTSQAIRAEAYASLRVTQSCRVLLDVDPWDISSRIMPDKSRIVWSVIDSTPALTWLAFTRHPQLIAQHWPPCVGHPDLGGDGQTNSKHRHNLWLGVSIACQEDAERLIPELLKCRDLAAKLFVSIEPLLENVNLTRWMDRLDWVIVGGESGPNARPCNVEWVRSIVWQCGRAEVPVFVKQLGANSDTRVSGAVHASMGVGVACKHGYDVCPKCDGSRSDKMWDPKGGDPSEWPDDLRAAREVPK